MKRALITGINGLYLAELLLSKGYQVHGIIRRASTFNTKRLDHIYQDPKQPNTRLSLHHGDLSSTAWVRNLDAPLDRRRRILSHATWKARKSKCFAGQRWLKEKRSGIILEMHSEKNPRHLLEECSRFAYSCKPCGTNHILALPQ